MKKKSTQFLLITVIFSVFLVLSNLAKAQDVSGDIKLSRFFDPPVITPGSTIIVNVFLDKGYRGGLARLDEFIPKGFTATQGDANGSHFYVTDSIVHFAWQGMPEDPGFTVTYRLQIPKKALGKYTLTAQFIYATSGGAVAAYFKPFTFTVQLPPKVEEAPKAAKPAAVPVQAKDTVIPAPVVAVSQPIPSAPVEKTETAPAQPSPETKTPPVANIKQPTDAAPKVSVSNSKPAPATPTNVTVNNGLWYRVQIMASSERLDADSVIINGIRDKLYIVTKNGISRYYIGAYHELQPALDYRSRIINNGLKGPFVVAYKDGNKITIKESLSIVKTN